MNTKKVKLAIEDNDQSGKQIKPRQQCGDVNSLGDRNEEFRIVYQMMKEGCAIEHPQSD